MGNVVLLRNAFKQCNVEMFLLVYIVSVCYKIEINFSF